MNAVPGAYEDGPANWAPKVIPPTLNDPSPFQQQIGAGPAATTISAAIDATTVATESMVRRTTGAVMLADRPFAEILAARERQLQMLDTGGDVLWWTVVGALVVAIVVVVWVLLLRMRAKPEPDE